MCKGSTRTIITEKQIKSKLFIKSHYYSLAGSTNCTDVTDIRWVFSALNQNISGLSSPQTHRCQRTKAENILKMHIFPSVTCSPQRKCSDAEFRPALKGRGGGGKQLTWCQRLIAFLQAKDVGIIPILRLDRAGVCSPAPRKPLLRPDVELTPIWKHCAVVSQMTLGGLYLTTALVRRTGLICSSSCIWRSQVLDDGADQNRPD